MIPTLALTSLALTGGDAPSPRAAALAHLPRPTTSAGAALHAERVYVLGGYTGRPHDYVVEDQADDFLALDPRTGRIEALPSIGPIQGTALVSDGERLIQVGGLRIRNRRGEPQALESVDEVRAYDPLARAWSDLPPLPAPRSSHDAFVLDDTLWVVGGWALTPGGDDHWHHTLLSLDLTADAPEWREHDQPFARRALSVTAHEGLLVVLGGIDVWGDVSSATAVFDPSTGRWTDGPDYPGFGFGTSMAPGRDGVVASGREGVLRVWSPESEAWRELGRLWLPRYFHRLVPDGAGGVIALGGIVDGGRPSLVEHLPADPEPVAGIALDVPSPMAAHNRQALFVDGTELLFVGGNNGTDQHDFAFERFEAAAWRLDLAGLRWERGADLPSARQTGRLQDLGDGRLAYVGGFAHDGERARAHAEVFLHDRRADTWRATASLPAPRTQYGLGRVDDDLWLVGGLEYDPDAEQPFSFPLEVLRAGIADELRFEPTGIELPEPRRAFASCVHDGRLWIVGGMGPDFTEVGTALVFDPGTGRFAPIAAPPRGVRISATLVPVGGRLALVAGTYLAGDGRARVIELYDPATDIWSDCPTELEFEAGHVHAAAFGDALLVASAQERPGRLHLRLIDPRLAGADGTDDRAVGTVEAGY